MSSVSSCPAFYSVANIAEDVPLNITMWSYVDQMNFAAISDRRRLAGMWQLTDLLRDELGLLVKAAADSP